MASTRRSSAVSGPKELDAITFSTCSVVKPAVRSSVIQRSRWASAAMVRYSATNWSKLDQRSCSWARV